MPPTGIEPTIPAMKLLHEGVQALAQVEANGIRIDEDYLAETLKETADRIAQLESSLKEDELWNEWKSIHGKKSKMGSRDQLATVLFDPKKGRGLPHKGLTETGKYKADAESFGHIDLAFVRDYLYLEKLKKTRNTFLKGIQKETVDGFIHPSFNLHLVISYRSSSDSPNFQNFPNRDVEMSKLVRQCFVSRPSHHLVEIDFGGIEVRVAACYNEDQTLINYILDPSTDMHRDTAAELFCTEAVSKPMRHIAKNMFVFPQFYGSYFYNCGLDIWSAIESLDNAEEIHQTLRKAGIRELGEKESNYDTGRIKTTAGTFLDHVRNVESSFWNDRFKTYTSWKKRHVALYNRRGWMRTKTGFTIRGYLERNDIINYPIQGSAFHCLLWSLIRLQKWMKKKRMRSKIVGQIHDSIVADVHRKEKDDFIYMAKKVMTTSLPKQWPWIIVPLEVETEVSPLNGSWAEKKGLQ